MYLLRYSDLSERGYSKDQVDAALFHPVMVKLYGEEDLKLAKEILGRETKSLRTVAHFYKLRVFTLCSGFKSLFEDLDKVLVEDELQTIEVTKDGKMYLPLNVPVNSLGGVAVLGAIESDALASALHLSRAFEDDEAPNSLNDLYQWCHSGHDIAGLRIIPRICADNICVECARCHRYYGVVCDKVGC